VFRCASGPQYRRDERTASSAISVSEWMNRLELCVSYGCLNNRRDVCSLHKPDQIMQGVWCLSVFRRDKHSGNWRVAANPVYFLTEFTCVPIGFFHQRVMHGKNGVSI